METSTVKWFKEFCGRNVDSVHNMESVLWHFLKCGWNNLNFPHCGNYNVDFPLHVKKGLKFSTKQEVKLFMPYNVQGEWEL